MYFSRQWEGALRTPQTHTTYYRWDLTTSAPEITGVVADASTSGGSILTINGKFFSATRPQLVHLRQPGFAWASTCIDTQVFDQGRRLECVLPPGGGTGIEVTVQHDASISATGKYLAPHDNATFSGLAYAPPDVTAIAGGPFPTRGSGTEFSMVVVGVNLGYAGAGGQVSVLYKGSALQTAEVSSSIVQVKAPPGTGVNNFLDSVTFMGQTTIPTSKFAYKKPEVLSVTPLDVHTTGGRVTINGDNFGADPAKLSVAIKGKPCTDVALTAAHTTASARATSSQAKTLAVSTPACASRSMSSPC